MRFDGEVLEVRFALWRVVTQAANIASAEPGRPLPGVEGAGRAAVARAIAGSRFGTVATRGVCIQFRDAGAAGSSRPALLRHPNLTVTVAEPDLLVTRLRQAIDAV